jgi:voltage-gated potassium channel Kch
MIITPVWTILVRFGRAIRVGWKDEDFRGLLYLASVVIAMGTLFYHFVESWSWIDSLYFTVITLTTVGYGDLAPGSPGGRLFTVAIVLMGIGILMAFIERVARYAAEDTSARRHRRRET